MGIDKDNDRYIVFIDEGIDVDSIASIVGGKGLGLFKIAKLGYRTSNAFIITSNAFNYFLNHNNLNEKINELIKNVDPSNISEVEKVSESLKRIIINSSLPKDLEDQIVTSYNNLCGDEMCRVAIRSSAIGEDAENASFAGQHDSFLNVIGVDEVIDKIKRVWASLYNPRAIIYRAEKDIGSSYQIAVVVQKMVDSRSSGVAFSLNPVNGDRSVVVIESIWGLGEFIVKGIVTPDRFIVSKDNLNILDKMISTKDKALVFDYTTKSSREIKIEESMANSQSISDDEIVELTKIIMDLEKKLGYPVDVEWAIDNDGTIYILQVRPETVWSAKLDTLKVKDVPNKRGIDRGKRVFKGVPASPGRVIGRAVILKSLNESSKIEFRDGDILVTLMTDPDWVPLMRKASAIVTERGGMTSHAAITSRELGIPAVVGVKDITKSLTTGTTIMVDGSTGVIEIIEDYEDHREYLQQHTQLSERLTYQPTATISKDRDQEVNIYDLVSYISDTLYIPTATKIYMNLGEPDLINKYRNLPFDGIGLMRIEFVLTSWVGYHPLYLIKLGKEDFFIDKLAEGIAMVAQAIFPRPVIVRFSDLKTNEYKRLKGGEEFEPDERNPMLGWRGAARYINPHYERAFRLEIKAIKKVREDMGLKNVWVMVPMVRTVWESEKVISIMEDEGLKRSRDFKIWAMAEVPSVAFMISELSKYYDGFSIGSNDLTQMVLGIDRDSEILADMGYFDERDEAVMKVMSIIIREAKKNNKMVSICGQAPSYYPEILEFLVREGIDSISVNPDAVIRTRKIVAGIELKLLLQKHYNSS